MPVSSGQWSVNSIVVALLLGVISLVGVAAGCTGLQPAATPLSAMRPPSPTATPAATLSDDGVTLTGYRPISADGLVPGHPTLVSLAWQRAATEERARYAVAQLVAPNGDVLDESTGRRIHFPVDAARTTTSHQLTLPAAPQYDGYTVVAGLSDAAGTDVTTATVGTLPVVRPVSKPVVVGPVEDYAEWRPGSVTPVRLDAAVDDWGPPIPDRDDENDETAPVSPVPIFLVHDPEVGSPFGVALYNRDPHKGCHVNWQASEELFINPCHGETYDRSGEYVRGPAVRGLDRFAVEVRDGEVVVDVGYLIPGSPREDDVSTRPPPTEEPAVTPPPSTLSPTEPATRTTIQALLDRVAAVRCDHDIDAYDALLDPDAPDSWRAERLERFRETSVQACPRSLEVTRIVTAGPWALAVVLVNDQGYVLQYLRTTGDEWRLTAPVPDVWGDRRTLDLEHVRLTFYEFDAPYVQAAAPHLDPYVEQVAADLGVPLDGRPPIELHVAPSSNRWLPFWDETSAPKIRSPLSVAGLVNRSTADSPADGMTWALYDALAGRVIVRAIGTDAIGAEWPRLVEAVRLWEVARARGRFSRERALAAVHDPEDRPPLSQFLDPSQTSRGVELQRLFAFITFVHDTSGPGALGPLVRAMVTETDWQQIVRSAFDEEPDAFRARWEAWAGRSVSAWRLADAPGGRVALVADFLERVRAAQREPALYRPAYELLTPRRRHNLSPDEFAAEWQDLPPLSGYERVWPAAEDEVRAELVWTREQANGERQAVHSFWHFTLQQTAEGEYDGWRIVGYGPPMATPTGPAKAVSTPVEVAREYVRDVYGPLWLDTLDVLYDEPWRDGRVLIIRVMNPRLRGEPDPVPTAVLLYVEQNGQGWRMRGGGGIGTVAALLDRYDVAHAWTWVQLEKVYAFYGVVEREDVARIELIEQDGTRHTADVSEQRAFFFPREHDADAWPPQEPADIRAYDAAGHELDVFTELSARMLPTLVGRGIAPLRRIVSFRARRTSVLCYVYATYRIRCRQSPPTDTPQGRLARYDGRFV